MPPKTELQTRAGRIEALQTEDDSRFRALLIPLNVETDDGRIFEEMEWRDPPLPLMGLKKTTFAHEDAEFIGNIENFQFETVDGTEWLTADIAWDESEEATEFKRLVEEERLTGLSADVSIVDADIDVTFDEDGFIDEMKLVVHLGKLMGATIVPMPAFEDSKVEVVASSDPVAPPDSWFADPEFEKLTPITTDGDRLFGHIAPWNECHLGITNTCVVAPRNETDYSVFLAAELETEEGNTVAVGQITLAGGHAGRSLTARKAAAHYDDTESAIADVAVGEDEHGIWFAGAIRPTATDMDRRSLKASKLSGDWRPFKGEMELVAVLCVNSPGFAIARSLVASGKQQALWLTGMVPTREKQLSNVLDRLEKVAATIEQQQLMAEAERLAAVVDTVRVALIGDHEPIVMVRDGAGNPVDLINT